MKSINGLIASNLARLSVIFRNIVGGLKSRRLCHYSRVQLTHDRIRKLDSCLRMCGALAFQEVPQSRDADGAFLPTALEDFTLHSDELPTFFICRYYLPLDISRNFHVISAAFDVFSLAGVLLVSCGKCSVA